MKKAYSVLNDNMIKILIIKYYKWFINKKTKSMRFLVIFVLNNIKNERIEKD